MKAEMNFSSFYVHQLLEILAVLYTEFFPP